MAKGKGKARQEDDDDDVMDVSEAESGEERRRGQRVEHEEDSSDEELDEEDAFNPNEIDHVQLRERTKKSRAHNAVIEDLKADAQAVPMPVLHKSLDTSNKIARRGENPDEAAIEATALHGIADILQVKTRNLRLDKNAFDAQDWLGKVALVLNSGDVERAADGDDDEIDRPNAEARAAEGWLKVGMMAMRHSLRVPAIDFMLGPLAIEPKKRPARDPATQTQRKADKPSDRQRTRPQQIQAEDAASGEKETSVAVEEIYDMLQKHGEDNGINFFRFVINPHSYGQTIENIFYLSFLFKAGKASLDDDADIEDGPMLLATQGPSDDDRAEGEANGTPLDNRQIVLEMTEALWLEAIELYEITESKIPHRTYKSRGQLTEQNSEEEDE